MTKTYKKFDGLWEFEKYINSTPLARHYRNASDQHSHRETAGYSNFSGTKTWQEAEKLFAHGDMTIAKEIESGVIATMKNSRRMTAKIESAVVGTVPHVPNYLAGIPTAMIRLRTMPKKTSVITAVYNISVNGNVSAEDMKDAAIKMLSAVKMLENSGVRVNLYLADISVGRGDTIGWAMRIKSAGQHLDILKTAYPLCHPSMLRRHSFRFTEVTENDFGYGMYGRAENDVTELCKECGIRDAVRIAYRDARQKTAKELAEYIIKQSGLKK